MRENGADILRALGLAVVCTICASWLVRAIAHRVGFVSNPNPLVPQHKSTVAYGGGIAVALGGATSWILIVAVRGWDAPSGGWGAPSSAVLLGALGFLILGIIDDRRALAPFPKLVWQVLLSTGTVVLGIGGQMTIHAVADVIIGVLWIVTLVNAVNLTDVCDGLVTGLMAIAFAAFGMLGWVDSTVAAVGVGAATAFLLFNGAPASMFLGDSGSHLVGFLLAAITLGALRNGDSSLRVVGSIALTVGVFLFELSFLVWMRTSRGVPVWRGSQDHFSLRLQAAGWSRWRVVAYACAAAAIMSSVALVAAVAPRTFTGLCVAVVVAAMIAADRLSYIGAKSVRRIGKATSA